MTHGDVLATVLLLVGCGEDVGITVDCQSEPDMEVVCGLRNPEVLALLPGGRFIVVSQGGAMDGSHAGSLALFEPGAGGHVPLFTGVTSGLATAWHLTRSLAD